MKLLKKSLKETKRIAKAWSDSKAGTYGASVAYYTVFSIAPLLVITIAIGSFFVNEASIQANIISQFESTFGSNGATFISSLVEANASQEKNIIFGIVGVVILLLGATGIFSQLQGALDTIFERLPDKEESRWIVRTLQRKLLSFGMVLSIGFLLVASLALSAIISSGAELLTSTLPGIEGFIHIIDLAVSFILISFFLSLIYKILPSKRLLWKPALVGGAITGLLFTVSKYVLGLYLGSGAALSSYGAASALVLLIVWAYYMSQVFFFSAILLRLYVINEST